MMIPWLGVAGLLGIIWVSSCRLKVSISLLLRFFKLRQKPLGVPFIGPRAWPESGLKPILMSSSNPSSQSTLKMQTLRLGLCIPFFRISPLLYPHFLIVEKVNRDANKAADWVAGLARVRGSFVVFSHDIPYQLRDLLLLDVRGTADPLSALI